MKCQREGVESFSIRNSASGGKEALALVGYVKRYQPLMIKSYKYISHETYDENRDQIYLPLSGKVPR
jgi:hypothetical protein